MNRLDGIRGESSTQFLSDLNRSEFTFVLPSFNRLMASLDGHATEERPVKKRATEERADTASLAIQAGDVIDFYGHCNTGKTSNLYLEAVYTIMPSVASLLRSTATQDNLSIPLPGRDSSVIVIDTENAWNILRIKQLATRVISHHIKLYLERNDMVTDYSEDALLEDIAVWIKPLLSRLHIFRPQDTTEILATIHSLDDHMTHHAKDNFSLLIFDTITTFYWEDKALSRSFTEGDRASAAIVDSVKQLAQLHNLIVFTTSQNLSSDRMDALRAQANRKLLSPSDPFNVPRSWSRATKIRFLLQRIPQPQHAFPSNIELAEGSSTLCAPHAFEYTAQLVKCPRLFQLDLSAAPCEQYTLPFADTQPIDVAFQPM